MSWLLLLSICVIAVSVSSLFQRLAMKEETSDPVVSVIIAQLLQGLIILIYAIFRGFTWPSLATLWPFFLFSATFYAFGSLSFFKSIKLIEASEMTILSGSGAIVTMICAYFFLGERLDFSQYVGAGLVLISVLIVAYRGHKFVFNQGAIMALLAASFYSFANISDMFVVKAGYDVISYAALMCILPGLLLCLMHPRKTLQLPRAFKTVNKNLIIYTLIYVIGVVTFYTSLSQGALISQAGVIIKANIVLTVILAAIFIGERDNFYRKVLAAALCMIGVILVA